MNIDKLLNFASDITDAVAEVSRRKEFREIVTFKEIADFAYQEKIKNPNIKSFLVSVKQNYDPQNENDKFIIIQGFLADNKQPISLDGKFSESRIIHTKTIDKKFLEVLNGLETAIIEI